MTWKYSSFEESRVLSTKHVEYELKNVDERM
uniref:Uncharacterized protein n=1 Tax=Anguilla anguilla TaxID=7936 RepID=A0A0E9W482_ANGAN